MKKKNGISGILQKITILPIIGLGIILAVISIINVKNIIGNLTKKELHHEAEMVMATLDAAFPGDYDSTNRGEILVVKKGDYTINDHFELFDQYKKKTDTEFTLFYGRIRLLTTLTDTDGNRLVGTEAGETIYNDIFQKESEKFYDNIVVNGERYFAYYIPVYNSDDSCVGMLAVLRDSQSVNNIIRRAVLNILFIILLATILTSVWVEYNARKFKTTFAQLTKALIKTSKGDLLNTVEPEVLARKDEFGDIGHAIVDMQKSIRDLVEIDGLTGLYNRRTGQKLLDDMIKESKIGRQEQLCVVLGDIDYFKRFNDTYGHDCGDQVLTLVGRTLKENLKNYGYPVRWGGEEFLLIIRGMDYNSAVELTEKILEDIRSATLTYKGQSLSITMTFGIVETSRYESIDEVVKEADKLLYQGKEGGRNCVVTQN